MGAKRKPKSYKTYQFEVTVHDVFVDVVGVQARSEKEARAQLDTILESNPIQDRKNTYDGTETSIKRYIPKPKTNES